MWITRPIGGEHALVHHFGQGRVREDRLDEVRLDQLGGLADRIALDQLGDLGADHVRAEQFAGLGVEHRLHEALDLAERDCLAIADRRELSDLDLVAGLLGLGLGEPDASDLRAAIGAAGNVLRVRRRADGRPCCRAPWRWPRQRSPPSWLRLVREPGRRGYVADRPNAGHVGAAHRIGVDMALGRFHAERLEADILGVGDDPDGDDGMAEALLAGLSIAGLDLGRDALASLTLRLSTPALVRIVSPCFCRLLASWALTSESSTGTTRSSISTTVTFAPRSA